MKIVVASLRWGNANQCGLLGNLLKNCRLQKVNANKKTEWKVCPENTNPVQCISEKCGGLAPSSEGMCMYSRSYVALDINREYLFLSGTLPNALSNDMGDNQSDLTLAQTSRNPNPGNSCVGLTFLFEGTTHFLLLYKW